MGWFDPVPGKNFWYRAGYWLSRSVARGFFSFSVQHAERIPKTGGVILAMNHQSFLDPPFAGICANRPIFFLARKTLLKIPLLGPILPKVNVIPVDRGGADMSAMKTVIRMIKEGESTVVFPEGTRTRDGALQPAQAGLGMIIAKTLAPVVPMRIFGAYEAFPRTSKFPRRRPVTIVVGEPIYFTEADLQGGGREVYQQLSERVMQRIATLSLEKAPVITLPAVVERGWWLVIGSVLAVVLALTTVALVRQGNERAKLEAIYENSAAGDYAYFPAAEPVNRTKPLVTFGGQKYFAADNIREESDGDMKRVGLDLGEKYWLYRRVKKDDGRLYLKVSPEHFLPLEAK